MKHLNVSYLKQLIYRYDLCLIYKFLDNYDLRYFNCTVCSCKIKSLFGCYVIYWSYLNIYYQKHIYELHFMAVLTYSSYSTSLSPLSFLKMKISRLMTSPCWASSPSFQYLNHWIHLFEIWEEPYAIGGHLNRATFSFLHSVITI